MPKGSQLSQLKSALSKAGLGPDSRKRKRSSSTTKERDRQKAQLETIHHKFNAFDTKETKLKHDVLGRNKTKGQKGHPTKSNQAGVETRKKTLLSEWEHRHHSGGIIDRRFGENDPSMSVEAKMLERFTRERKRTSHLDKFNLEDEEELTHYGQSLSKLDDFEDVGLGEDDEEDEEAPKSGQINRDIVRKTHFGGFSDDEEDEGDSPPRKKTKSEVMAEVIAKSKEHKLQRQIQRQQDDNLRHQLDQEFDSLRSLLISTDSMPAAPSSDNTVAPPIASEPEAYAKDSTYDALVKELVFDARSKPKDRTKTEEELALEEQERLLKAEKRRRLAMLGLPDNESDGLATGQKGKRRRQGDDLEDDFEGGYDDLDGLGSGIKERNSSLSSTESEDSAVENSDDEEDQQLDDSEGLATTLAQELPYTFPCPKTHSEFLKILKNVGDADVPTVVKRIRALYHPSLAPDNKQKLQTFVGVLLEHILSITTNLSLITALMPHLAALTKQYPKSSADHFVEQLSKIHQNLERSVSNPSLPLRMDLAGLALFRLIPLMFPTSDLHHLVISPARLLMGAYLSLGLPRLRDIQDVASGLFVVSLVLEWEEPVSKRWVPEAPAFLANILVRMHPDRFDIKKLPGSFPLPNIDNSSHLRLSQPNPTPTKPNLLRLLNDGSTVTDSEKAGLLHLAVTLVGRFAEMYQTLDGFIEVFEPFGTLLSFLADAVEGQLKDSALATKERLESVVSASRINRRPLRLQSHKPIPLPSRAPQFSEKISSSYLHRDSQDKESSKLRKAYKEERKGAIRELRKDARFLARAEQERQKDKDEQYKARMRRVFGSIEGERSEQKKMEKEKQKEKRRAGRK